MKRRTVQKFGFGSKSRIRDVMEDLDTYQIICLQPDYASETIADVYISKDAGTGKTTLQTKQTKKLYEA